MLSQHLLSQQVNGKRSQPVFAFIGAAENVAEPLIGMSGRTLLQQRDARIASGQAIGDPLKTPSTRQIQSRQMNNVTVGHVTDLDR